MIISKVISKVFQEGLKLIKVQAKGRSDVRIGYEIAPFGFDGKAPEGYRALICKTESAEDEVIIGYINLKQLESLGDGESRMFSVDANGEVSAFIIMRSDGNIELNGVADNAVRYAELETAFNQLQADHDDTVSKLNAVIDTLQSWTVVPQDGGAGLQLAAQALQDAVNSTADITPAKIEEIKTP